MEKSSKKSQKKQGEIQNIKLKHFELKPENLRWTCPNKFFKFKTTKELQPLDQIVGQPRAIEAIRLGAELFAKGYNVFVTGLSGTGRLTTVKRILENVTSHKPKLYDYVYVNNFNNPDEPRLLRLPKGKGKEFASAMKDAISYLRRRLPKLFEEDTFQLSRKKIIEEYQEKEREILNRFDERIRPFGFVRGQIENEQGILQPEVFPLIDNKAVHVDGLEEYISNGKITVEQAKKIKDLYQIFHNQIFDLAREGMKLMQEYRDALAENDKAASSIVIKAVLDDIRSKFSDEKIATYLDEVRDYILDNLTIFLPSTNSLQQIDQTGTKGDTETFQVFSVNVILDNSNTDSAPVIIETTPSFTNLFGTIERTYDSSGYWRTDFTKIKAGAVLRADQGYLIVNAIDLFSEQGVWQTLMRVLLYDKLEIQPYDAVFQLSQLHMKPEPINVNLKVIIIGGQSLYQLLYLYEKGFKKIFKVHAQFDYEIDRSIEMLDNLARFVCKICNEENLPHCTPDGVAAIAEWSVEQAGSQNKMTLKFSDIADIIRESAFYDRGSKRKYINREDVEKAIEMRMIRNNMLDEKLSKYILENDILIDTEGERVGQVNGLTVIDTGVISFGKPARITSTISTGTSGIINIEREVDMSGKIHNKGVLILSGLLRERFAQKKPMNLTASIAFEQSYSGIDGDSATAAEIYAIISAISNIPIKQTIAVTGSVNQKGDVQPIGGVNEKIVGFFEICNARGLNGKHGVIIPIQNVKDLMLPKFVIDKVKEKKFHIYPITTIEEGVEILMDMPAGIADKEGNYPENTIFGQVQKRLDELRIASKELKEEQKNTKMKKVESKEEEEKNEQKI